MHRYTVSDSVKQRLLQRQGKLLSHDTIDAARTALVVVDMQNHFVAEGFPAEVPLSREIVPAINRLAKAVRNAGGEVVWIQTTATGALDHWGNHHRYMLTPERVAKRLASLDEAAEGFKLYPALEPAASDLRVKKIKYSAFIAGSSDIDAQLKSRGIETLLITGTATNVCCEFDCARRHDARLSRHHALGRQCHVDRRRACQDARQLHAVLRRRDDVGRGDCTARAGGEPQARLAARHLARLISAITQLSYRHCPA